jgi:nicotinamide-nucleotide amidase
VFTIGGLGPTEDDLTRDGIAAALDDRLIPDPDLEKELRAIFVTRKLNWVDSQLRQTYRPTCGKGIKNPNGTAPGLVCTKNGKTVIAMPGPRNEFIPMAEGPVHELLAQMTSHGVIHSKLLRVCGIGEGVLEQTIKDLLESQNPTVAPYAKTGEVHLRVTAFARSQSEAEDLITPMEVQIRSRFGTAVYGVDGESLESVIVDLLRSRGAKLAVVESCTGGGLGSRITSVPGASDVFVGGLITYSNEVKSQLAGVEVEMFESEGPGAVSEECAKQMADGTALRLGVDYAVSITGVAGPGGGTESKPVGRVFIGVHTPEGTLVHKEGFRGSREGIRERAVQWALIYLRERLI